MIKTKPSHGGFENFFSPGTYAIMGTNCVEPENVMKSAQKNKNKKQKNKKKD